VPKVWRSGAVGHFVSFIGYSNKPVKATRRPLAVLKFGFYQGSAASFCLRWRRAPYRNVGRTYPVLSSGMSKNRILPMLFKITIIYNLL